ncbi:DUF4038 domain-containing protein [candidate division KSB1 bacterium]|nr:DUF4038 domain-containing protein [candidate division KSB1 bacterium]
MQVRTTEKNRMLEWVFRSAKRYADPFNDVEINVTLITPSGVKLQIPAFWAGGNQWYVRFASGEIGKHRFETQCSDSSNQDLHGRTGEFEVVPYTGANPLFQHGLLNIAPDKRHLQHRDGTPFFWLGDTWWMGLCKRLKWPGEFQSLAHDRIEKGYTVIQIVAGLYPDMPEFDERGANEGGFPWEPGYSRINPDYFDRMDIRIEWLVNHGLVPCIVGCWGYFINFMGVEKMKQHWRYLIARYAALPVVWCLAGEATMSYYLSQNREADSRQEKDGWTELAGYVKTLNAFGHPVTIHPTQYGREQIHEPGLLDFDMLQTGHSSHQSFPNTIKSVVHSLNQIPKMPVLVGEVCYEGILEASREEVQRMLFWGSMLSGAAGHTYGANGIWQVNTREKAFGASPHGSSWGNLPWEDACRLPGSAHLGIGKRLLEKYPWWQFEPHPEWVNTAGDPSDAYFRAYAAGIPRKVRMIYFSPFLPLKQVNGIEKDVNYQAILANPSTGEIHEFGAVVADGDGNWKPPQAPVFRDWLLILTV